MGKEENDNMTVYCIAIHVPIYTDGPRTFVISEWARALELLRNSLSDRFTRFLLVAPSLPAESAQSLLEPIGVDDGFEPIASISHTMTKEDYWFRGGRRQWKADVSRAYDIADFGHMAADNLYRPIAFDAEKLARSRNLPRVFFVDTDAVLQIQNMIKAGQIANRPDRKIYTWAYERTLRRIVTHADVSFLKGQRLWKRYSGHARNPKAFQDTSYRLSEIVPEDIITKRLETRSNGALRLVYCGRLVARKGCHDAISAVAQARSNGADITLDLIGDGPERPQLEALAKGQGEAIRFLGERPYGASLLQELAGYDALLFTPVAEDTPRMIFDGYAAGLPLLGADIPYVKERADEEKATLLLPLGDTEQTAQRLSALARDQGQLASLTRAAVLAGQNNATDLWYQRRAEWTFEAFDKVRVSQT